MFVPSHSGDASIGSISLDSSVDETSKTFEASKSGGCAFEAWWDDDENVAYLMMMMTTIDEEFSIDTLLSTMPRNKKKR